MTAKIHPVVLCGGAGTRLWPMSRRMLPKQFLPLVSERSMLQDTVLRLAGLENLAPPIIVSNNDHRFLVGEQLREVGIEGAAQVLEPIGRNTAPAVAAAALEALARDPEALLLVLAADHMIRDVYRFHDATRAAAAVARGGRLVTFGIKPTEPATGYGYIELGDPIPGQAGAFSVARFVEKPDRKTAEGFLASGRFAWNSGMFVLGARQYLEELAALAPEIANGARAAWERAACDLDFRRLDEKAFAACPSDSIDYAVMEKTRHAAVIPADIGWSDVGSWSTLWEVSGKDAAGNATRGDVHLADARNCYVRAESRMVSVIGADDLVVVETDDAILVAHRDKVQAVKDVVGHLDRANRGEAVSHRRVYRPWGWYESVADGERYQVKRIMVKPGASLSLQMHHHRAEHWVVVSGTARVTRGEECVLVAENESTFIPLGKRHRLENPGKLPLFLVEVQSGSYLGEDDIVRFEDRYKRV
jgi:mannose-1-phosphate guanylyltransferase/mannose-6-phosphate isomerase